MASVSFDALAPTCFGRVILTSATLNVEHPLVEG